jgi:hypothetical protein
MSEKVTGGYLSTAPHRPEDVPRNCWTCLKKVLVFGGQTTCHAMECENSMHVKNDIDACEKYELDPIWLTADWFYVQRARS